MRAGRIPRSHALLEDLDLIVPEAEPEEPDELEARLEELRDEARYFLHLDPDATLEEIQAAFAASLRDFWIFFFPHYRHDAEDEDDGGIPDRAEELAAYQDDFLEALQTLVLDAARRGRRARRQLARAYPREHAKSVFASLLLVVWTLACLHRRFAVIFSDTDPQAVQFLEDIRHEIDSNERLQAVFPGFCTWGAKPRADRLVFGNETQVMSRGSGRSVRGMRRGAQRPDLIIGDDIDRDGEVENPKRRAKKMRWWNRVVKKLGKTALFVIVGTILHAESFLALQVQSKADIHRAITRYPDRMDLWEQWEAVFHDRSRADREADARAFYEGHRAEMDAGAVLLWPGGFTLYQLMVERAEDLASFLSERQNDPFDPAASYFPEEALVFLEEKDRPALDQVRLSVGFWDPSRGTSKSDTSAAFRVDALKDGRRVVSWGVAGRIMPDEVIETIVGAHRIRPFGMFGVEKVGLSNYDGDLQRVSRAAGVTLPVHPVTPSGEKTLRIKSMRPMVVSGGLLFYSDLPLEAIQQIKYFGQHPADDVWDSIQQANKLLDELLQDVQAASGSRDGDDGGRVERESFFDRPAGLISGLGERLGRIREAWS